ncbi:MAG TPA: hypothetical protein IAC04_05510 [Candidatus Coprenecus stercoravium]|uniref:Uncharacterized protein n=1 Tax=Candidatus Coprenecus stercoravium TaxID=2840735 RepID=A0A9D2KAG2_9BACT|nr:hypothetical protein [Candidatus Coprenecus stercoravium]
MIRINDKEFPSRWEELSPEQWLGVVGAMLEFGSRQCDFASFQIKLLEAIVGKLPQDPSNPVLCENIFRLQEVFCWPYVYAYKDPRYDKLSERTKEMLRHHLPSQLDQSDPEVRIASSFETRVDFDLCFPAQLLPHLPSDPALTGYRFSCRGTLASTDMTARQYVAAMGLLEAFSPDAEYLDEILSSLLCVLYSGEDVDMEQYHGGRIPLTEKVAVMYNFRAVNEWVSRLPKYDLLFNRSAARKGSRSPLGMEGSLYALSEKGYGDIDKVGGMNLFTYLDVLLKQTMDSVRSLHSCKMKPHEIAGELSLSVEQVLNIISE